jgi:acyl-CoA synthetase (AMP-forming)/AMP-acid ligase II
VDPERHFALEPGQIGEIWVAGGSKCQGYWNNPELGLRIFHARLVASQKSPFALMFVIRRSNGARWLDVAVLPPGGGI